MLAKTREGETEGEGDKTESYTESPPRRLALVQPFSERAPDPTCARYRAEHVTNSIRTIPPLEL